jgi:hypothetical protein
LQKGWTWDVVVCEIAAIIGHATIAEVQRYTIAADRKRLAKSAMAKLVEGDREHRSGKPERRVANPSTNPMTAKEPKMSLVDRRGSNWALDFNNHLPIKKELISRGKERITFSRFDPARAPGRPVVGKHSIKVAAHSLRFVLQRHVRHVMHALRALRIRIERSE